MIAEEGKASGDVQEIIMGLLARRLPGSTVCPSEIARAITPTGSGSPDDWRAMMPTVHAVVDQLLIKKMVRLSWKDVPLATRAGPYRIGRGEGVVD